MFVKTTKTNPGLPIRQNFFKQWEYLAETHFYTSILRLQVFFPLREEKETQPSAGAEF
jgi:hypothetical protein